MRWTKKQTNALLDSIGSVGWKGLQRRTGHTKAEIWAKVRRSFGGGGITRGSYSLEEAMQETGYSRSQLERACRACNMVWKRTAKGGNFTITAEQLELMASWLKTDYWCVKHHLYACSDCETSERPHYSGGLCLRCYRRSARWLALRGYRLRAQILLDYALSTGASLDKEKLKLGRLPALSLLQKVIP